MCRTTVTRQDVSDETKNFVRILVPLSPSVLTLSLIIFLTKFPNSTSSPVVVDVVLVFRCALLLKKRDPTNQLCFVLRTTSRRSPARFSFPRSWISAPSFRPSTISFAEKPVPGRKVAFFRSAVCFIFVLRKKGKQLLPPWPSRRDLKL